MNISVVVVSYNVCAQLRACLATLAGAYEVVVVDNASRDGSAAMVRAEFPAVSLLALADNVGFSRAVNLAAARAQGDAYLLLNPDAELDAEGVGRLGAALARHPRAWAVGCRQVDESGHWQLSLGPRPTLLREALRRTVQRRLDRGQHGLGRWLDRRLRAARPVPWVAGSCLLVYAWAFARVGGFDARYFLFFEDIDFCLRLARAGGQVVYVAEVTALHRRGQSAATDPGLAARAYRASQRLFWDWHGGPLRAAAVRAYLRSCAKG